MMALILVVNVFPCMFMPSGAVSFFDMDEYDAASLGLDVFTAWYNTYTYSNRTDTLSNLDGLRPVLTF